MNLSEHFLGRVMYINKFPLENSQMFLEKINGWLGGTMSPFPEADSITH